MNLIKLLNWFDLSNLHTTQINETKLAKHEREKKNHTKPAHPNIERLPLNWVAMSMKLTILFGKYFKSSFLFFDNKTLIIKTCFLDSKIRL